MVRAARAALIKLSFADGGGQATYYPCSRGLITVERARNVCVYVAETTMPLTECPGANVNRHDRATFLVFLCARSSDDTRIVEIELSWRGRFKGAHVRR